MIFNPNCDVWAEAYCLLIKNNMHFAVKGNSLKTNVSLYMSIFSIRCLFEISTSNACSSCQDFMQDFSLRSICHTVVRVSVKPGLWTRGLD